MEYLQRQSRLLTRGRLLKIQLRLAYAQRVQVLAVLILLRALDNQTHRGLPERLFGIVRVQPVVFRRSHVSVTRAAEEAICKQTDHQRSGVWRPCSAQPGTQ